MQKLQYKVLLSLLTIIKHSIVYTCMFTRSGTQSYWDIPNKLLNKVDKRFFLCYFLRRFFLKQIAKHQQTMIPRLRKSTTNNAHICIIIISFTATQVIHIRRHGLTMQKNHMWKHLTQPWTCVTVLTSVFLNLAFRLFMLV